MHSEHQEQSQFDLKKIKQIVRTAFNPAVFAISVFISS
jgi:hypothetical protein